MDARKIRDIERYNLLYGHKELELYVVDDKVLSVMKEIVDLDIPEFNGVDLPFISKRKLKRDAKSFYDSKLFLHDVGYLSDKDLIFLLRNSLINSFDDLVSLYNDAGILISPFSIPIKYDKEKVFAGTLETQLLIMDDDHINEILKKLNIYFNHIFLSKYPTNIATSCYIHEIMHSQLESQKGIVEDFYNTEVLSIFMEMLYAYEKNDVEYYMILGLRINHLCSSFYRMHLFQTDQIEDEKYELYDFCCDGKYFISILKAFNLLLKYINSNNNGKKIILTEIQKVINGYKNLEEMLGVFDVNYESSLDSSITNRLLKI